MMSCSDLPPHFSLDCRPSVEDASLILPPLAPMTGHVTADLPCPEDKDAGPLPRPNYVVDDIVHIQSILDNFLPPELSDTIIDMAELWPYVEISRNSYTSSCTALKGPDDNAQWCYLVSPPVPSLERNGEALPTTVKKVKFHVRSYDSAWGGRKPQRMAGKAQGFETWFETSVLRPTDVEAKSYSETSHPQEWFTSLSGDNPKFANDFFGDEDDTSQPTANPFDERRRWKLTEGAPRDEDWHEIVWTPNQSGNASGFIDSLCVGDRILLLARAKGSGWTNTIFNVKMEIYYSLQSDL